MPDKIRVAVVGHTGRGDYGHGLADVWVGIPECEIVGVADPDEAGRARIAKMLKAPKAFADYRAMFDELKPTVVSICPRHLDQHHEMVLAAAERGIHMYLEKPLCRTLEEADAMVAACEKHDVKLAVAFQTRYSPKIQVIRDLIADGKLGKLLEIRGRGKEDARGGGEDLWVLGSHVTNLMCALGGEPQWCFSRVTQGGHKIAKSDVAPGKEGIGPLAGDSIQAMYGMSSGATGYFASTRGAGTESKGARFGLQLFGTAGVLDIVFGYLPACHFLPDPLWSPGRSKAQWIPVSSAGLNEPEPIVDGSIPAGNLVACKDLLAAIKEDRQPEASVYEARTTIEMIAGVFESARVGGPVTIPLKERRNPLTLIE